MHHSLSIKEGIKRKERWLALWVWWMLGFVGLMGGWFIGTLAFSL
jgi:hypothetical protein